MGLRDHIHVPMFYRLPHKNLIGSFILEEPAFVNWIKETFLSSRKEDKEIPQLKELMPRLTPEAVVSEVCKDFAIDKESVIKDGMKRNKARDIAIYLSRNHSGITCKELGVFWQCVRYDNNNGL